MTGKYFKNKICVNCSNKEDLTLHHIKYPNGKKTGQTQILCRHCHDKAEREYERLGIVKRPELIPLTQNERLQLDYMSGLLPFYSINRPKISFK